MPHLAHNQSAIYNMFVKQHGGEAGPNMSATGGSISDESTNERLAQMQKTMVVLQKKEKFAKKTLYES